MQIQGHEVQETRCHGVFIHHLGPLDGRRLLLVLGRMNYWKKSPVIDRLALAFRQHGVTVCWHEPRAIRNARLRHDGLTSIRGRWSDVFQQRHVLTGRLLRRGIRCWLHYRYPKRPMFRRRKDGHTPADVVGELRRFLDGQAEASVDLLGHSAGCLAAVMLVDSPAVRRIVGIGYPFRHPGSADEAYRTAGLQSIGKHCLILPGDEDEYGTAADASRYPMADTVAVCSMPSDHEYLEMTPDAEQAMQQRVFEFVGLGGSAATEDHVAAVPGVVPTGPQGQRQ